MKKTTKNIGFLTAMLSAALALPQAAQAIGVLLPNQDPEAVARGNAFAATADNPSAIYYNPAGISQISGFDFELEDINYLGINSHYSPPNGTASQHTDFQVTEVPQFFATYSPTNLPLSFGLGLYSPFGLGTEWPGNGSLRTLAIESRMTYLTLSPVVAYKITPTLSISAGPTFNYSRLKFRRGLATPFDQYTFKGDGWAYGGTAGILWQPTEKWSFGLDYRSETRMNYGGNSLYEVGAGTGIHFSTPTTANAILPTIVSGGVSFRPSEKWNLEFDVDYINWDSLNSIGLNGTKALFVKNLALNLNWKDSWQYKFGVTRNFENGWFVSAGYFYSTETAPEAYYTPAVPDTELHTGSIGFGRHGEHWSWAITGQLIAGPRRTIETEPTNVNPFTTASPAGKYQLVIPAVDLSVSYHF